ncbi:hypothetical protein [Kistimonas scapharcae]|uniref:hypothetical protein n=1 Tax=Kistimonas scapharcae TaxID=1036133 RepID=UPI0031E620D1
MDRIRHSFRQSSRSLKKNPSKTAKPPKKGKVAKADVEPHSSQGSTLSTDKQPLTDFIGARATKSTLIRMEQVILAGKDTTPPQPETSLEPICEPETSAPEATPSSSLSHKASTTQTPNAEQHTRVATIFTLSGLKNTPIRMKLMKPLQRLTHIISAETITYIESIKGQPLQDLLSQCSIGVCQHSCRPNSSRFLKLIS